MRVLITGAAGFVGRHLAEQLLERGEDEVWGLARSWTRAAGLDERVRLVAADLCDRDAVNGALETVRPDAIYHLASRRRSRSRSTTHYRRSSTTSSGR